MEVKHKLPVYRQTFKTIRNKILLSDSSHARKCHITSLDIRNILWGHNTAESGSQYQHSEEHIADDVQI
jgi:hypothetical protein